MNTAVDEFLTIAGKGLERPIGNLAGQPEPAGRVTVGACVSLDEDAMEYRILGIVNPVLFGQVLTADANIHTPHRSEAQPGGGRSHLARYLITHRADQKGQRHRADELL